MAEEGLTNIIAVAVQPVGSIYDITDVPADTPETIPVAEPIAAIAVLLLLHVPPAVASVNVVVWAWHTLVAPDIACNGSTLTVKLVRQLEPSV